MENEITEGKSKIEMISVAKVETSQIESKPNSKNTEDVVMGKIINGCRKLCVGDQDILTDKQDNSNTVVTRTEANSPSESSSDLEEADDSFNGLDGFDPITKRWMWNGKPFEPYDITKIKDHPAPDWRTAFKELLKPKVLKTSAVGIDNPVYGTETPSLNILDQTKTPDMCPAELRQSKEHQLSLQVYSKKNVPKSAALSRLKKKQQKHMSDEEKSILRIFVLGKEFRPKNDNLTLSDSDVEDVNCSKSKTDICTASTSTDSSDSADQGDKPLLKGFIAPNLAYTIEDAMKARKYEVPSEVWDDEMINEW